jgi:hypothetical protein
VSALPKKFDTIEDVTEYKEYGCVLFDLGQDQDDD